MKRHRAERLGSENVFSGSPSQTFSSYCLLLEYCSVARTRYRYYDMNDIASVLYIIVRYCWYAEVAS